MRLATGFDIQTYLGSTVSRYLGRYCVEQAALRLLFNAWNVNFHVTSRESEMFLSSGSPGGQAVRAGQGRASR